jgi:hypothetical protein
MGVEKVGSRTLVSGWEVFEARYSSHFEKSSRLKLTREVGDE